MRRSGQSPERIQEWLDSQVVSSAEWENITAVLGETSASVEGDSRPTISSREDVGPSAELDRRRESLFGARLPPRDTSNDLPPGVNSPGPIPLRSKDRGGPLGDRKFDMVESARRRSGNSSSIQSALEEEFDSLVRMMTADTPAGWS
jgi:hypothetical protein